MKLVLCAVGEGDNHHAAQRALEARAPLLLELLSLLLMLRCLPTERAIGEECDFPGSRKMQLGVVLEAEKNVLPY